MEWEREREEEEEGGGGGEGGGMRSMVAQNLFFWYSYSSYARELTEDMLVWLASMRPLTLWADWMCGGFLDKATYSNEHH